jgi:hypothetical protein
MLRNAILALALPALGDCTLAPVGPAPTQLTWTAPTTNEDGTPLMDLAGFRVYVLPSNTAHIETQILVPQTTYALENLQPGLYSAWVTAVDQEGNESRPSNRVTFRR